MDSDYMTGAPGLLADAADLLSRLGLASLPPLHNLSFTYSRTDRAWSITAQLSTVGDEAAQIDAIRTWAAALGGEIQLDDVTESGAGYYASYRQLEAVKALDFGVCFRLWTHVAKTPVSSVELIAA